MADPKLCPLQLEARSQTKPIALSRQPAARYSAPDLELRFEKRRKLVPIRWFNVQLHHQGRGGERLEHFELTCSDGYVLQTWGNISGVVWVTSGSRR